MEIGDVAVPGAAGVAFRLDNFLTPSAAFVSFRHFLSDPFHHCLHPHCINRCTVNLLDYILAVILVYCLIRGIFRGLVKELAALIGVLGGFYFAFNYYPQMTKILERWITTAAYAQIISFFVLFFGVYLVVSIAGVIIKYLMNIAWLGWTDRLTGALFGAIKGVLIVSVIVAILTSFLPKNTTFLRDSLLVRHTSGISSLLVRIASADMKALYDTHLKELNQTWQRTTK